MKQIIIVFIVAATFLNAGWMRGYGREGEEVLDRGYSVQQTTDGGYIITGYTNDEINHSELYLIKTDSLGDTLWTRMYGTPGLSEGGKCVRQTTDGGYVITGYVGDEGDLWPGGFLWLVKTDENGDTLWTHKYGDWASEGNWVEQTDDGGYIVTGDYGHAYLWLFKTNSNGIIEWQVKYDDGGREVSYCVQPTFDGGFILGANIGLIKTDSAGEFQWISPYGTGCVRQITDGGYILASSHYKDVWLIKMDENGDTVWTRTYGGAEEDYSYDVQQTTDGGYIIIAQTRSFGAGNYDAWLLKTDSLGDTLWTRMFGGDGVDQAYCVQQTTDGGYVFTGNTNLFSDDWTGDVWLVKTDSLGYVGIAEPPVPVTLHDWQVISSIGTQITLRYENRPQGFAASIFNAAGQKVDEVRSASPSGVVTWGDGMSPGVYFIRESAQGSTARVVIAR